jgi:streptogramin lyase
VSKAAAYKFEWDGTSYVNPQEIAKTVSGPKKSIAINKAGDVFVAVMGAPGQGRIARIEKNGQESSFPVRGMPIWLAAGPKGYVYVPIAADALILVYRADGTLEEEIPYQVKEGGVSDILIAPDGSIYLAFFHSGQILRISYSAPLWHAEYLPYNFGTPGGIAMDSRGRLYVSDFTGNAIDVIY